MAWAGPLRRPVRRLVVRRRRRLLGQEKGAWFCVGRAALHARIVGLKLTIHASSEARVPTLKNRPLDSEEGTHVAEHVAQLILSQLVIHV